MDVIVEKSQAAQKNCTKIEKEEKHAHRKRARSTASREGRLSCNSDAPHVGSARSDSTTVIKVNCRKMRPCRV